MAHKSMIITTDDEVVEIAEACPACGERRVEHLVNRDGIATCQSCGHVYDLEPERRKSEEEAANAQVRTQA